MFKFFGWLTEAIANATCAGIVKGTVRGISIVSNGKCQLDLPAIAGPETEEPKPAKLSHKK